MPLIPVRDITVYYEVQGSGPRLLFIGSSGSELLHGSMAFNSSLVSSFEVLAYDQRGQGRTDAPDTPYTMADYAADAAGLLAAVGWDRCLVTGFSFGGMVAQELAIRYPERVERMVLISTSSGGAGGSSYPLHEFDELAPEERAQRMMEIIDSRHDAAWRAANPERVQASVVQVTGRDDVDPAEAKRQAVGRRRLMDARKTHDTYDRLPALQMPVLVTGGRYDGNTPPATVEGLARPIPGVELEIFEGGHLFFLADPRAWERISAFLLG